MTCTTSAATDEIDGLPVSMRAEGEPMPGGTLAWDRLGIGMRCETWLAWSSDLWCPVVVKLPRPHQLAHPRARRSLAREVAALDGLAHPNLPHLYADGTSAAEPYLVLEHVDGTPLDEEVDDAGAFDPDDVAVLGAALLSALRALHRRGVAHLDLKPDNIVLRNGRPVLLDLGSARPIGAGQPAGRPIGSAGYAAPELEAGAPIAAAMDLYGLGVVLHELLTGEPAFDAGLDAADRPAVPALPDSAVAPVVVALCDPDPTRRPTTAAALREFGSAAGREVWPGWAHP